jgi:hypothetical protein
VDVVEPLMVKHADPELLQRAQAYEYVLVGPLHVPGLAVSVWPTEGTPLIDGSWVEMGASWPGGVVAELPPAAGLQTAANATTTANGKWRRPTCTLSTGGLKSLRSHGSVLVFSLN